MDDDPDADDGTAPDEFLPESVAALPPTARVIYRALVTTGAETQSELAAVTGSPERTVRHALGQLEDAGAVEKTIPLTDTRLRTYTVSDSASKSDGS